LKLTVRLCSGRGGDDGDAKSRMSILLDPLAAPSHIVGAAWPQTKLLAAECNPRRRDFAAASSTAQPRDDSRLDATSRGFAGTSRTSDDAITGSYVIYLLIIYNIILLEC
jgi:hypothetical protein